MQQYWKLKFQLILHSPVNTKHIYCNLSINRFKMYKNTKPHVSTNNISLIWTILNIPLTKKWTLFTAFHHDQGRRQGATAIIEFFSVTRAHVKNFEGSRGRLCSSKGVGRLCHGTMASPSLEGRHHGPMPRAAETLAPPLQVMQEFVPYM